MRLSALLARSELGSSGRFHFASMAINFFKLSGP
jgi:hypothetical protein